jgi:hypothetical protein
MTLILEIRRLLFDEGLTIAGARREVESLVESGKLDLKAAPIDQPPARKKPAPKKPRTKAAKAKPKKKAEPEVDKAPSADVQPLLATLRGVRKELAEIVEEMKR